MSQEKNTYHSLFIPSERESAFIGFILLHRRIKDHWIWENPEKLKWWIDILMTVNHSDQRVNVGNALIDCKRGQSVRSIGTWARNWRVHESKVRRFFELLEKDGMIVTESVQKSTRITVCKYDSYNKIRRDGDEMATNKRRDGDEDATTKKEVLNNGNHVNNESVSVNGATHTHTEFIDHEIWYYNTLVDYINENASRVAAMPEQLTIKQAAQLCQQYPGEPGNSYVKALIEAINNSKNPGISVFQQIKRFSRQEKNEHLLVLRKKSVDLKESFKKYREEQFATMKTTNTTA